MHTNFSTRSSSLYCCESPDTQYTGDSLRCTFPVAGPQSGTLSRITSETRPSVQTVSDVCLKRTCLLDTSAFSALEVLDDNRAL